MADKIRHTKSLQQDLLAWYGVEARDLPWRQTEDPYAIWISEIMLQQTRVEAVLSYYARFLERFPTIEALASASIDGVLKAWEGLGYYRRAHNLHRAAKVVIEEHDGHVPASAKELRTLPGIGPYTAGAIASIAFGLDEPVLDGNVVRVLSRLYCIGGDPSLSRTKKVLLGKAAALIPQGEASRFNQGLMDLGARICRPRSPRCHECPVATHCDAHHTGHEVLFPERRARKGVPHVDIVSGIVWDDRPFSSGARHLIAKRNEDDMLGGLWEFPGGRVEEGESFEEALTRELREELAIDVEVIAPFMHLDHAYTHFRITLYVYHCRHTGGEPESIECADWTWARPDELESYAFPTADRKILDALAAQRSGSADEKPGGFS
jgi:A/G-specific adenine glycosylase